MDDLIKDFKDYHLEQLNAISTLEASKDKVLFKKILYISFVESLAKARYPKINGSRQRFITFLQKNTNWDDCDKYSLIHMVKNGNFPEELHNLGQEKVDSLLNGNMFHDSLLSLSAYGINKEDIEIEVANELLESCSYGTILYKVRNGIVHQFQASIEADHPEEEKEPTFNIRTEMDIKKKNEKSTLEPTKQSLEIVFPNVFLESLAKDGLNSFLNYCQEENLNPFTLYYNQDQILNEKSL